MTTKADVTEAIEIERTFNAPVARVWQALTDVDQMRQWYFDLKEFRPEVGFEFEFVVEHEGNSYHHLCKVTEVIPQKKIAYTWRYKGEPGNSLVTLELFDEGEKTRLKLRMKESKVSRKLQHTRGRISKPAGRNLSVPNSRDLLSRTEICGTKRDQVAPRGRRPCQVTR